MEETSQTSVIWTLHATHLPKVQYLRANLLE